MAGTSRRTPRSQALADGLRRVREEAPGKPSLRELTSRLGWKHPQLQRFETGTRSPSEEQVAAILDELGVHGQTREELLELARGEGWSTWLAVTIAEHERQLAALLRLEDAAKRIVHVSSLLIPGPLQTRNYARAIMVAGEVPQHEIDTRVAVRLGRKDAFVRETDPVDMLALIWEPVLRSDIGGSRVMAEQLRHLVTMAKLETVDLRVIPGNAGWHAGLETPYVLIEDEDDEANVHVETRHLGLFLHKPEDVAPYKQGAEKVLRKAMSEADSIKLIAREAERIEEIAHGDGT
jgi:transcriptional regulator with XRE-family HTH domain